LNKITKTLNLITFLRGGISPTPIIHSTMTKFWVQIRISELHCNSLKDSPWRLLLLLLLSSVGLITRPEESYWLWWVVCVI